MPQPATARADSWDLDAGSVELNAAGRIVDYLDSTTTRADTPDERVRQAYARVLHEEYLYPKDRTVFGPAINIGRETRFADIAVYSSAAAATARDQGRIVLVVETKAPNVADGKGQLASYILASSAQGGVWTNGEEAAYFRRVGAELQAWTNIPRAGETWDTVGHYRKDELKPPRDLKRVFKRCHNAIYRAGLDSEDVALDMVRIILAKYQDEQNPGDTCEFRCTPEEFATREGRTDVATRVHRLFKQVVMNYTDVFPDGENITIGDDNLAVVVNELQPFRFLADEDTEQVYDVIGTAFEVYVATHLKGQRGQYFTNRLVVNMMVEVLNPTERDVIFDPACGSGGFLIACLRYVRTGILSSGRRAEARKRAIRSASERLFGMDIAPKLVRVAKTNMILNGDGHGGIVHSNTLHVPTAWPEAFPLRPNGGRVVPTTILTNPPFGASHELRERNGTVLSQFQLGHAWEPEEEGSRWLRPTAGVLSSEGVPPEILFLERCIALLAPGGKLAIVIARGVLDNREALPARQFILQQTKLLAVINCHPNTFAPFNGTKAGIIVVEKKRAPGFPAQRRLSSVHGG
jgi:type I restriction enzyme M protein